MIPFIELATTLPHSSLEYQFFKLLWIFFCHFLGQVSRYEVCKREAKKERGKFTRVKKKKRRYSSSVPHPAELYPGFHVALSD